ncbi:hypothetical protein F4604DRAFT_1570894 [Suillus subluteus]|nr:hypothetical protein F4604DRAFT_1580628 [Suillus subluteus]KAG1887389.1 hypothetical protein F4604DRAFT_1570894 [Suillus subluteus]
MTNNSDHVSHFPLLSNINYSEWSIRMEVERIQKGLWDMVFTEVDVEGKTNEEVKVELQKLLVKRSVKKMAEARAEIILHVECDQLAHMRDHDPKLIWETLTQVHHACGLGTRMAL